MKIALCGGISVFFLFATPFTTHADLVFTFEPTFRVNHAGVSFYNGNPDDINVPPPPIVVHTSDFSSATHEWTFEQLVTPWVPDGSDVPLERGIFIVERIDPDTFEIEGGVAIRGESYDFVHTAWSAVSASTVNTMLSLMPLGDPATPSGTYKIIFANLPEFKFVYDPLTDTETVSPLTDDDLDMLLENNPNVFADLHYSSSIVFDYVADAPPPSEPDPVIIIPGILGSEQHNGEWVIDPILHTYDDLIATLDANGYTPEEDLFTFPYDWRKSNVETALLLKQKIDEVKTICACDKVDLVAHSMGGLVARQYIQSDDYQKDVDQLIFLGTPHLGAPKAYLMWEGGELGPIEPLAPVNSIVDELMELILDHEAYEKHYPSLFAYLRTEPINSVRELLPIYDYIFDADVLRQYPQNYPTNVFLENLNNNINRLLDAGVEIHNIIGDVSDQRTITGIQAVDPTPYLPVWGHGYPDGFFDIFSSDNGLLRGSGDNTVPLPSASFINSNLVTTTYRHGDLPVEAQVEVYRALRNEDPATIVKNFQLPNARTILIKILSPADLLVVAPDGSKIGKDFDGQEVNGIPNAFYTGFTADTEFITILNPLDGEYKLYTQGTDSGPYTVETAYMSEVETVEKSFTGNTTPSLVTELNVEVDNGNPETMEILPADTEPPVITITTPEAKDYVRSGQLPVNVSAGDVGSGVYALETFIDSTLIPNVGSVDLFFESLGSHTLLASSTDNVGNAATSTRTFRVIATIDSTLSDIDRAYNLGWMSKKVYKEIREDFRDSVKTKKGKKVVDKGDIRDILKELKKYRSKGLNEQGYQLLKADFEWLINN